MEVQGRRASCCLLLLSNDDDDAATGQAYDARPYRGASRFIILSKPHTHGEEGRKTSHECVWFMVVKMSYKHHLCCYQTPARLKHISHAEEKKSHEIL